MSEYQGQPDYVVAGYLCDLYEPWANIICDEWGDYMAAMHTLIERCLSISNEERAFILLDWFREELEDVIPDIYTQYCWSAIEAAQDQYETITEYWRERAKTFKGEAALEDCIASLPEWIKPDPNRSPPEDPERKEYERLKAKFG